jgi:hypothetical protein
LARDFLFLLLLLMLLFLLLLFLYLPLHIKAIIFFWRVITHNDLLFEATLRILVLVIKSFILDVNLTTETPDREKIRKKATKLSL